MKRQDDMCLPLPTVGSDLFTQIANPANFDKAWDKLCKHSNSASGVDWLTVDQSYQLYSEHHEQFIQDLWDDRYRPKPVRQCPINKPDGSKRYLGIPTFRDRAVHRAILQITEPLVDPYFSRFSFGYRRGLSVHDAALEVQQCIQEGYTWVADVDLKAYFDSVEHPALLAALAVVFDDPRLLRLIRRLLKSGICIGRTVQPTTRGVTQGAPASPLLSNIFLHSLDVELTKRGLRFIRYADDFVIMARSPRAANRIMKHITAFLRNSLELTVNSHKSTVTPTEALVFVGFSYPGGQVRISDRAYEKFRISLTHRMDKVPAKDYQPWLTKARNSMSGWLNHYGRLEDPRQIYTLSDWIHDVTYRTGCAVGRPRSKSIFALKDAWSKVFTRWERRRSIRSRNESPAADMSL